MPKGRRPDPEDDDLLELELGDDPEDAGVLRISRRRFRNLIWMVTMGFIASTVVLFTFAVAGLVGVVLLGVILILLLIVLQDQD